MTAKSKLWRAPFNLVNSPHAVVLSDVVYLGMDREDCCVVVKSISGGQWYVSAKGQTELEALYTNFVQALDDYLRLAGNGG